jgi:hypothetical protein
MRCIGRESSLTGEILIFAKKFYLSNGGDLCPLKTYKPGNTYPEKLPRLLQIKQPDPIPAHLLTFYD